MTKTSNGSYAAAGVDTVVLLPRPIAQAERLIELTAREVMPRLAGGVRG